jgi:hypothetical protein
VVLSTGQLWSLIIRQIMHVDVPLGRPKEKRKAGGTKKVDVKEKAAADLEVVVDDIRAVDGFLNRYETAKIVVVVHTTCDQVNGKFIWEGHDAETYKGGTLLQVSTSKYRPTLAPQIPSSRGRSSKGLSQKPFGSTSTALSTPLSTNIRVSFSTWPLEPRSRNVALGTLC